MMHDSITRSNRVMLAWFNSMLMIIFHKCHMLDFSSEIQLRTLFRGNTTSGEYNITKINEFGTW